MDINPCLRTYDILFLIFQECFLHRTDPVDEDSKPTIRTICSVIRTCKAFHGPAADLLWRHQSSLLPLIKCLPSDLWEDRLVKDSRVLTFKRRIVPADFKRLDIYSPRIFYLSRTDFNDSLDLGSLDTLYMHELLTLNSQGNIDEKSLCALKACRPSMLLPNLRQFEFTYTPFMWVYPLVARILGPKLEVLTLQLKTSKETYSFLRLLRQICPNLTELSLSYPPEDQTIIQTLSDVICALPKLEKLSTGGLFPHALFHLAKFPNLRSLRLRNPLSNRLQLVSGRIFPHLRELELVTDVSCVLFAEFIRALGAHDLRKLCMAVTAAGSSDAYMEPWYECLSAVRKNCTPTSLEYLSIGVYSKAVLDASFFDTLLTFPNLKQVHVSTTVNFGLNDTLVERMTLAWPKLEVLCLDEEYTAEDESLVTANGLILLLKNLHSLRELSLPAINFGKRPKWRLHLDEQGVEPLNHAITTLGVGNTYVSELEVYGTGYFLLDLLPNLDSINFWPHTNTDPEEYMARLWNWIEISLERHKKERRGESIEWDTESNALPEF